MTSLSRRLRMWTHRRGVVYAISVLLTVGLAVIGLMVWRSSGVETVSYFTDGEVVGTPQRGDSPTERIVRVRWSDPRGRQHVAVLTVSEQDIEDGRVPLYVEQTPQDLVRVGKPSSGPSTGDIAILAGVVLVAALFAVVVVNTMYGFGGMLPDQGARPTSESKGFYWRG